jgi:hypothetical protein
MAFLIEFENRVRPFVDDPDVVLPVDTDRVSKGPRVDVLPDLADELSVGVELEQLRGGRHVRRAVDIPA